MWDKINELSKRKIYITDGSYLILEQTSAFFAIDVNSGKNLHIGAKELNLLACSEICRMIKVLGIGGKIIIDFLPCSKSEKKVIYDFRQEDIQNNGQGAPLTPIFHHILSKKINQNFNIKFPIGFLNIGGIANVTKVINDSDNFQNNLSAFDIGPGNCLIDEWVRNNSNKKFDKNGELSNAGKVDQLILNQAIDNFKINSYSQSLDIKNFDVSFAKGLTLEDAFLYLRDSDGNLVAYDDQSGGNNNAQIIYTATESGTYYLDAQSYVDLYTGAYTLTATNLGGDDDGGGDQPNDDYSSDTNTTGSLTVGIKSI